VQNTPCPSLTIAYVSPGFELGSTHASTNAMTAYAMHLLSHIYKVIPRSWTLTILSSHKRTSAGHAKLPTTETLSSPPIRIERCFNGNSIGFLRLLSAIRRYRFDVVHFQHETHLYGGPLSMLLFPLFIGLTRFITTPIVTLHHVVRPQQVNATFARMHHTHIPPFFIRWGYRIFFRLLGAFAPSIVVHNDLFKTILIQEYAIPAEHIAVIPHGVEDPTVDASSCNRQELFQRFHIPQNTETIFGFFGYFTGYKGIEFLLEEFGKHARKFPKSILLIGGLPAEAHAEKKSYQTYVSNLQKLAEKTAPGQVIWYGAVHEAQVGQYFRLIDCLVLPYRLCFASSGPLSYAIGSSTPFLASEEMRPLVPYENLLFPLRNGALTEKLDAFAKLSPTERESLTTPLQALRETHRWDAVARSTVQTYERSLAQRTHHTDIFLVGAYGQQNTGDELLLDCCLARLPRHRCTVASAQPQRTEEQHHVFSIHSHKQRLTLLHHIWQAQTIVVGGGDQFKLLKRSMGRTRHVLLLQCFLLTLLGRLLRKSVVFVGVGVGDISTVTARFLTVKTLQWATAVSFRDRESYDFCQKSAPGVRALLSADLAFLRFPVIERDTQSTPVHRLGIAPVYNMDHAEQYAHVTRELGKATDGFLGRESERSAVFLPFQTGYSPHHDIVVGQEILAHIEQSHRCSIEESFGIERIDETYHSIDVLWGMRLHSIILSCMYAIPFIALVYDVKVRKFLEEIDCMQWGIPLDESFSAEKLLALHRQLEEHAPDMRHHLHKQAERLAGRADINANLLQQIAADVCTASTADCKNPVLTAESYHFPSTT